MTPLVTLLVLAAAVMHAGWNALLKAGNDKVVLQALVMAAGGVPAAMLLAVVPLPAPAAWPFILLSVVVHGVYYFTLVNAYRAGDLSLVYPIARGSSPLMIALGGWAFAAEALSPGEWLGIAIASAGIMSLTATGRLTRAMELRAIGFALATAVMIALYSLADGMGVRRTPEPFSYIAWMFALDAIPVTLVALWLRRGRVAASFGPSLRDGIAGGLIASLAYAIVIWAMSRAPIAHVSALRESSVIIATLIGTLGMGEGFGRRRVVAAVLVVGGNVLLHLTG